MRNKKTRVRITRFVAVFLILSILSFSNAPYQLLSAGLGLYQDINNVVDKMWRSEHDGNVVDNFVGTREAIERLRVQDARAAANGDGVLLYGKSVNNGIWARTFTAPSTLAAEVNIASSITDIVRFIKQEASPTREETIAVVQTAISTTGSGIFALRNTAGTWTIDWCVRTGGGTFGGATCTNATYVSNANTTRRGFDITYENTSGDAMVVYSSGVATTNEMKYRTWNGTAWSAETNLDTARLTGVVMWVELEAKRTASANEITALFADANQDLSALVWDGTSVWGTEPAAALETALEDIGAGTSVTIKSFDGAYETASGDYIASWGFASTADVKHVTRPSAGAWSAVTTNTAFPEIGTNVEMEADYAATSNYVIHASQDPVAADNQCVTWSGTAWPATPANCDTTAGAMIAGNHGFGIEVLTNTAKRAVVIWPEVASASMNIYMSDPAGNTWTATTFALTGAASAITTPVATDNDPFNANTMTVVLQKGTGLQMVKGVMDTAGVMTWTNLGAGIIATSPTTGLYQPFSFAYYRFLAPPSSTLAIAVTAGSKVTTLNSGDLDQYVHVNSPSCATEATCSGFKMTATGGTVTVTSIKITQNGTMTSTDTKLSDLNLYYDLNADPTAGLTLYGTTAAFTSGAATVTGSVGVAVGTPVYFYVRVDLTNGASCATGCPIGGETINFQILANADVVIGSSTITSTAPYTLAGTTTILPKSSSISYAVGGNGGRSADTATISGFGFGAPSLDADQQDCATATVNTKGCVRFIVGGAATVLGTSIGTWNNTTIVVTIAAGLASYGGTAAVEVVAAAQATGTDLNYKVYPNITSLSVAEAREGSTLNINGDHFGTGAGANTVTIDAVTATVGTWAETVLTTVTVPAAINDANDTVTIRAYQGTGGDNALFDDSTGFIILPDITSMTTCAADVPAGRDNACGTNAAQEYAAGDTFGLIMLVGNHFGTAAGTVSFTGGFGSIVGTVHATAEGACSTGGWAAAATSVCVEVNSTINNTVYDGTVTLDRLGGSGTDVDTISLRILPRIVTNTPTGDIRGNVIQIDGDHFCQTAPCPATPPTVDYIAYFGSTQALAADFVTTPNCTGAAKWSDTQVCVKVPSATPTGTQNTKLQGKASPLYESQRKAFTVQSTVPADPTNLRQFKSDGTTTITTGTGKTNETTVKLKADLSASLSIAMIVQVEVKKTGTAFDGTGIVDGTGCTSTACADATATVTGLTDTTPDGLYHWRARTKNTATLEVSNWVNFNAGSTAFIVDLTTPAITFAPTDDCAGATNPGPVGTNSAVIDWSLNESGDGQVEYSINSDLSASTNFPTTPAASATSQAITLSNLSSGTTYFFKVKSRDAAGNLGARPSISPFCSFATGSVSQPGKTTSFHVAGATGEITAAANYFFTVVAPETAVSVKSAFVEVAGIVRGGSNPITVKVNGVASRAYSVSATNPTKFKFVYQITSPGTETNLNLNDVTPCTNDNTPAAPPETPPCNTLTVTPGASMTVNVTSARIIVNYAYTP